MKLPILTTTLVVGATVTSALQDPAPAFTLTTFDKLSKMDPPNENHLCFCRPAAQGHIQDPDAPPCICFIAGANSTNRISQQDIEAALERLITQDNWNRSLRGNDVHRASSTAPSVASDHSSRCVSAILPAEDLETSGASAHNSEWTRDVVYCFAIFMFVLNVVFPMLWFLVISPGPA
ncbi:uncharacterized protein GGS25DRAFT_522424 [Hypoxylon fragiforme]|uniref:uncharacterized protein n=1 Tax=Hypoxylon fragiforme TaxID=63214 RepID=UPI0020C639CB|nr:uncharacterized protein GGS25DRAFT_522424 [Hypoxylon fragiforme]KAI2606908.1 hypothetical protein GGS25DRAFT_522424 [Hypoxylon fragiforme]